MMTAEQLKGSILQLAMQGKLVEQRSSEGTGEDLYKEIQTEKKRLLKEGALKKQKPLLEITVEEMPFDIPESWKWVKLGDISSYAQPKEKVSPKDITPEMWSLDLEDIEKGTGKVLNHVLAKERKIQGDKVRFKKGNILYSKLRPYLLKILIADNEGITTPELVPFNIYGINDSKFFLWYLRSPYVDNAVNSVSYGVKMPRVGTETMVNLLVPLPPLAEQKRIVAKIEELMPFVEQYAAASTKLNTLNTSFPEMMKKSILQEAVQGKLVPQDPNDEPASLLLKKIAEEKKRLIKEGKIKKQKPLPEITEDEIPFDIPESWEWVRVNDILVLENGDRSNKYPKEMDYVDEGVPFFGARDMVNGKMDFSSVRFISEDKYNELGGGKLKDGDLVCLLRGSVGKIACFYENEQYSTGFICAQMVIMRLIIKELLPYIQVMTETPYYKKSIGSRVTGTAVRQLPAAEISKVVIPIPPLAEQKRIVSKIHEMMISVIELTDKSEL